MRIEATRAEVYSERRLQTYSNRLNCLFLKLSQFVLHENESVLMIKLHLSSLVYQLLIGGS